MGIGVWPWTVAADVLKDQADSRLLPRRKSNAKHPSKFTPRSALGEGKL